MIDFTSYFKQTKLKVTMLNRVMRQTERQTRPPLKPR